MEGWGRGRGYDNCEYGDVIVKTVYESNLAAAASDQSRQQKTEREAALWWRFDCEGGRPSFLRSSVTPPRAEAEQHWVIQMWLGQAAFERRVFSEAEQQFRSAVLEAEKLADGSHLATAMRWLGRSLCAQGKHEEADRLYKRALELHEQVGGPTSLELEEDFDALIAHFRMQGKYRDAEELIRKVLEKLEKLENSSPILARYLNNLAVLLCEDGRCNEAEEIYGRVLELTRTFTGEQRIAYAVALLNQGVLYYKNGRLVEARNMYERGANILNALPDPARHQKTLNYYKELVGDRAQVTEQQMAPSPYFHTSIPGGEMLHEHVDKR